MMVKDSAKHPMRGIFIALSTPLFLGLAPIFGKQAIGYVDAFTVATLRTMVAVGLLWVVYLLFYRRYLFIYPAGLLGCVVIGVINGIGSLFYYSSLTVLSPSLAQLINGMYLAFALIISRAAGQKANPLMSLRIGLALAALILLVDIRGGQVDWVGVGLMLGSALMFAGTLLLSQYVLFEMPAQTAAIYILSTMGLLVVMVRLAAGEFPTNDSLNLALPPIVALGITTALSRLAIFMGVKFLGGIQTAVLAVMEIAVTLVFAYVAFQDTLSPVQWLGVLLLFGCLLLIRQQDLMPYGYNPNSLIIANMASVQFQSIAFYRAFGTKSMDDAAGTMSTVTTQELLAISKMMGAQNGGIDPYPIGKSNQLLAKLLDDWQIATDTQEGKRVVEADKPEM
ncbi:MAG: DMT family transporter [Armatimonadetes bacterium]|nr:DMT family transporter [Anaerolineae bacterium]